MPLFLDGLLIIFLQVMREKLIYAIMNCTDMDADYRATETDVVGWRLE